MFKTATHWVQHEEPAQVNTLLSQFFAELRIRKNKEVITRWPCLRGYPDWLRNIQQ